MGVGDEGKDRISLYQRDHELQHYKNGACQRVAAVSGEESITNVALSMQQAKG